MLLLMSADYFKITLSKKIILVTLLEYQTVWIQIAPDIVPKCFAKSHKQSTKAAYSKETDNIKLQL